MAHKPRIYRAVFREHNGDGPYDCHFCGDEVSWPKVVVHHDDHDEENNDPGNLVPTHHRCHDRHHRSKPLSAEHRAKISESVKAYLAENPRPITDEMRERTRQRFQGRSLSPEHREKIRQASLRRWAKERGE